MVSNHAPETRLALLTSRHAVPSPASVVGVGGAAVRVNQGMAVLETRKEACGIDPTSPPPCYKVLANDFQFPPAGVSLDHRGFFQIIREPCLQDPGRGPRCVGSESWVSGYVWECGLEAVPQAPPS